jgi:signal transduction histidine kinase/ActR/RegA family two-component response regulator
LNLFSSNFLKTILEKSINGLILIDSKLNILFYNEFIIDSCKFDIKQFDNKSLLTAFPEIINTRLHKSIIGCLDNNHSVILTSSINKRLFPFYRKSNDFYMNHTVFLNPSFLSESGKIVTIQIRDDSSVLYREKFLRDKHEKEKELNQKLNKEIIGKEKYQNELINNKIELENSIEKLKKIHKEKNDLIGIVAHDLKNPLSILKYLSNELLEYSEFSKEHQEKLSMIHENTLGMISLVEDLLDIETIESGEFKHSPKIIEPVGIVQKVINMHLINSSNKKIKLKFESFIDSARIFCDKKSLFQILENFVSNAIKFSPQNSIVEVKIQKIEGNIIFSVKDSGPGLSVEDQTKLFQKFTKLTPKPSFGESSSGLGLYITKKLAESAGGKVYCETILGEGSTFYLQFPVNSNSTEIENNELNPFSFQLDKKLKILSLDDEIIFGKILKSNLTKIGCEVEFTENSIQAIELLKQTKYDIVFIDMNMPQMSGLEFLNVLKNQIDNKNIPYTVLMSGEVTLQNFDTYNNLGFDSIVNKDFNIDSLKKILLDYQRQSSKSLYHIP